MGFVNYVKNQFIDLIEYVDGSSEKTLVHKYQRKGNEVKQGSRLIVREGQAAAFIHKGELADVFLPGNYRLETGNLPFLSSLGAFPTRFESAIRSDLYFINTTQFINNKWSTKNPIMKRDSEMGIVRINSNGNFSFKIGDPVLFMAEVYGARELNMTDDIKEYLTSFVTEAISQCLGESSHSVIDMATDYRGLSTIVTEYANEKAKTIGFEISLATIESLNLPEEVERYIDEQSGIGLASRDMDKFVQYQSARAIRDAAKQSGGLAGLGAGMGVGKMVADTMGESLPKSSHKTEGVSIADELLRYKELLDQGILTEVEYDKVKVELLKGI